MKLSTHALLYASGAAAFGGLTFDDAPSKIVSARQAAPSGINLGKLQQQLLIALTMEGPAKDNPDFDAKSQLVDVSGIHAFKPPGPNDARGPCPGLNALANHAYLPRNGLADIATFTAACLDVYNMGPDLGAVLSAYGAVFDGVIAGWSIGGEQHTGIGGSHNNYESDSSPLRGDLSQRGTNTDLIMSQFQQLYDMQPDPSTANYNIDILAKFRKSRFDESIAKNPNFMYAPFSGPTVTQAAFMFIYRFMANHSAEHPAGLLNKEVFKSFMSVQGPEDNLKWVPGNERIPENWYKRNGDDRFGLEGVGADFQKFFAMDSRISQPGCNTGKVNSYQVINSSDTSSGAYRPEDAASNPLCYGLAMANAAAKNFLIVNYVIAELLLPAQNALGCRTVPSLNESAYDACPGYSFWGGPTGPVAQGAVQR